MTTALASDSVAFNSRYNLESFLQGIDDLLKKSYDLKLDDPGNAIRARSRVIPPGIDFSAIDAAGDSRSEDAPVILWNHRWEHDKNPDLFFTTLFDLERRGVDFRLVVLGESFRAYPAVFDEARERLRLRERILHFGYVKSRREYASWLKRCDIAVSTAGHEFFGISVIEAVRAGCRPLLPRRLSYPELFPEEFLYDDEDFACRLMQELSGHRRLPPVLAEELTGRFSWDTLAPVYEAWDQGCITARLPTGCGLFSHA